MIDPLNLMQDDKGLLAQRDVFGRSGDPSNSPPTSLRRVFVPVLTVLLFAGASLWAKGHDPFRRIWFKVQTATSGKAECVAVLPKMAQTSGKVQRLPVVIYLHGSGDSIMADGNDLRQLAEMGLAAVSMQYNRTNQTVSDEQLTALLAHLGRQSWADGSRVAWVGLSLGAQRLLSFALKHPALQPPLLVRLAGGWVPELEPGRAPPSITNSQLPVVQERQTPPMSVLLVHGELDDVFLLADACRVQSWLLTNGVPTELMVMADQTHAFAENRRLVFRAVGEYCLNRLKGPNAFKNYRSILAWQSQSTPLWVYWMPAAGWVALWAAFKWRAKIPVKNERQVPLTNGRKALRLMACILALVALVQTVLHLVPLCLNVSKGTLHLARKHLMSRKETDEFDDLSAQSIWQGRKLGTLLEHVELAHYNMYELVNWKLESGLYRDYVLCPNIDAQFDGDLQWRRTLWENFYPRIRKEHSPLNAAVIVVRFLRERVTILRGTKYAAPIEQAWERQIIDERGFEALYVAAMRSVGIPARLPTERGAELWDGASWRRAPRPLIETAMGLEPSVDSRVNTQDVSRSPK